MSREAVARAICPLRLGKCCQKFPGLECRALSYYGGDADAALAAIPITDEVVEAACRAVDDYYSGGKEGSFEGSVRAALEAALKVWKS